MFMRAIQCIVCSSFLIPAWLFAGDDFLFNLQREQRRVFAHTVKSAVAEFDENQQLPTQNRNGDEQLYADLRGSFGKALAHLPTGFIDPVSFRSLVFALNKGKYKEFNKIILGDGFRKLVNPQACFAFSLSGNDAWINAIPPAPPFASAETAGEMVELYWTALVRDVPFNQFAANTTAAAAVAELNTLTDFKGPKINGQVTPQTFLRGNGEGELIGPYISQFLYQTVPYGSTTIGPEQRVPLAIKGNDFMTDFATWFQIVNGGESVGVITYDQTPHFLRTPRDLGEYVHQDTPGQASLNAALILNSYGVNALDENCPYRDNPTQNGFVTYGIGQVLALTQDAVEEALKSAWYQKWQVNRRVRPEEYGFYVQKQVADGMALGINPQLTTSQAIQQINTTFGSFFLPQAYPEGCPSHPAYPAGHAAFIGAGVTILKAIFDENFVIPTPLQPNAANTALEPYQGLPLTIGSELNKLASNIALGRDHAGVHYRSDGYYGILLGEMVAIDILNNAAFLDNEDFEGYHLTTFNGVQILVGSKKSV